MAGQPDLHVQERRARSAAVTCLAAVALILAGCTTGTGGEPTPTPSTSPSATPSVTASVTPSPSPTATPTGASVVVPVYFMIDTRTGLRLAREQRPVTGSDPIRAAVEAMIAGPTDPDYTTTWNHATRVLGTSRVDGAIVVDVSADARTANVGSAGAALMIQQLVYTATGAAGEPGTPVLMRIDGKTAGELWGVVSWDAPVAREDPISVRLLVQIDSPAQGATTTSPLRVTGEAAVFEAVLHWAVRDAAGVEVSSGVTMTAEGQTFAPYEFQVELTPGTYTVVITEDDPSDGAGGTPMSDSRTVTVT
ncbi:MAG TPA: Gmad2 immunoglobulin-like domain-containing protein [Cellulomonas sp.]|uniref:Gmad2 immunoglobulin-like domain-containing protein n=1 Tax=Cellulomonas sp. TaxID=40001 RepID=UPI002E372332|nr:Gmad2 immunoglobulin-like domain-containing protein [Cellulomonas sp.]HEX5331400.1 Gmad2 immunoglobulin-like domain-containing protein [Cellulomonas sp.]